MKLSAILYLCGCLVVFFSVVALVMTFFSEGTDGMMIIISIFGITNGLISIGIGEILHRVNKNERGKSLND